MVNTHQEHKETRTVSFFMVYLKKDVKKMDVLSKKEEKIFQNAVFFSKDNLGIEKDDSKCIDCGECQNTCNRLCQIKIKEHPENCLACGQCILTCPTNALKPKKARDKIIEAEKEGKTLICYTSPAIRVSFGEAFGQKPGTFTIEKLIGALKKIGFDYVLDTTFGADLTILEEAMELKERIKEEKNLPLMTSCCPAWVKYVCDQEPELISHLSTCKSPIGMQGEMVKKYFCEQMKIDKENTFTVAITPCTAKKMEIKEPQITGTDAVLTMTELVDWLKEEQISWDNCEEKTFDSLWKEGSGGGSLFGITGGVTSSLLRTYYFLETGQNKENISFDSLHDEDGFKTLEIEVNDRKINVAVVQKLAKIKPLLDEIRNKKSPYQVIEVMNCEGGCVGGGGQIKYEPTKKQEVIKLRKQGLKARDKEVAIRFAHQNPDIKKIYEDFLIVLNGEIAKKYLHRSYEKEN